MRIYILITFLCVFSAVAENSYAQSESLTLKVTNASIRDCIKHIEQSMDYYFLIMDDSEKELTKIVSIDLEQKTIDEILTHLLNNTQLSYRIVKQQITIRKNPSLAVTTTKDMLQKEIEQQDRRTIRGTITDIQGETIIGANIIEKGTTNGTVTDIDGNFSLTVGQNSVIVISYIGYVHQEINTTGQSIFNIVLHEDAGILDEVVVVGYGQQKKASVVGAIVQVKGDDLRRSGGVSDFSQVLTGNLPGVTTVQTTGRPGEEQTKIYIRGRSTWNNTDPLILVDGIERKLNDIDPSEVESVSTLKDASATAVYGVEGANGVILITTKRGQVGKPTLSFEASSAFKNISKVYEQIGLMDALKHQNYTVERETGIAPNSWVNYFPTELMQYYDKSRYPESQYPEYADMYPNVNWADQMLKDYSVSSKLSLMLRGGTNFVKYFGNLSYTQEGDMMNTKDLGHGYNPKYSYDRFNFRSNLDFNLTRTTLFTVNLSGHLSTKKYVESNPGELFNWLGIYGFPSNVYPVQHSDGIYGDSDNNRLKNPYLLINRSGVRVTFGNQINTDYKLNQKLDFITKGLSAGIDVSLDYSSQSVSSIVEGKTVQGKYYLKDVIYADLADREDYAVYINKNMQSSNYFQTEELLNRVAESISAGQLGRNLFYQAKLNYDRTFGKHDVTALALVNRRERSLGSAFKTYREDWVGRITYSYDTRYLAEVNAAYNGSDNFAEEYRFELFPSLALGWTLSNEKFMQKYVPQINHLKFRYSVGITGNDRIGSGKWPYQGSYSSVGINQHAFRFGNPSITDSGYGIWYEKSIANPDIHWEVSEKQNYGIEWGIFRNLISGNFDFYKEHRSDIFMSSAQRNIPIYTGYAANPAGNIGIVDSWGWEAELKFRKNIRDFNLWSNFAFTHANNEVKFREDGALTPVYQKRAGFSLGQNVTRINSGIIQDWNDLYGGVLYETNALTLPGDFRQVDYNADGVIDTNDNVPFGHTNIPMNTFTWTLGGDYKGFSLMLQFYGVYNVTYSIGMQEFMGHDNQPVLYNKQVDNAWLPQNNNTHSATYHALRYNTDNAPSSNTGDYYLYDASYLRLKTAEIAYTFTDNKYLKKMAISSLRLYVNGNNLFLKTDLPVDSEGANSITANDKYPTMRRINLGLSVTF